MSNDWGQDFDEDGNVLGEVPEPESSWFGTHWKAVLLAAVVVFIVQAPRILATNGSGIGVFVGLAGGSLFLGVPLAYVAVWLREQF